MFFLLQISEPVTDWAKIPSLSLKNLDSFPSALKVLATKNNQQVQGPARWTKYCENCGVFSLGPFIVFHPYFPASIANNLHLI